MPGAATWIIGTWTEEQRQQQIRDLQDLGDRRLEALRQQEYHNQLEHRQYGRSFEIERNVLQSGFGLIVEKGPRGDWVPQDPPITESDQSITRRLLKNE